MFNVLASATVLTDLAADYAPYLAAGVTLCAAVLGGRMVFKWLKGVGGRAS